MEINAASFWQYSLEKYTIDEVKQACLVLQDDYAYNVNVLLFCMLCDSLIITLNEKQIKQILAHIAVSESALQKHRLKRIQVKKHANDANDAESEKQFKADYALLLKEELRLELAQQILIIDAFADSSDTTMSPTNVQEQRDSLSHYSSIVRARNSHATDKEQAKASEARLEKNSTKTDNEYIEILRKRTH